MNTWVKTGVTASALCAALVLAACGPERNTHVEAVGPVTDKTSEFECTSALGLSSFSAGSGGSKSGGSKSSTKKSGGSTSGTKKSGSSKPAKPATKKPSVKAKTCATDYELMVNTKDGVVEQDVTEEVWRACTKGEEYPKCANETK